MENGVCSTDASGRHWDTPRSLGVPGQTSCAADMGGARLLLIYSHREHTEQPGIKITVSEDTGQT